MSRRPPSLVEVLRVFSATILLVLCIHGATAQDLNLYVKGATKATPNHVAYVELGGAGYYYSINYEHKVVQRSTFAMFGRIGFEYLPVRQADRIIHLPLGAAFTLGQRKHRFEAGMAGLFRIDFSAMAFGEGFYLTNPPTRIFMAPSLGWRFHAKPNEYGESFLLRVMFTPLIGMDVFNSMPYFLPHGGISIGRTWNNPKRLKG